MAADEVVEGKGRRRKGRRTAEADINETNEENEVIEERSLVESKGRVTPGRRNRQGGEAVSSGNFITRSFTGIRDYFNGVSDEMSKVVWPNREELIRLTRIVIIVTILAAIGLGLIAFFFTELFILGFENEWVFAVFFALVVVGVFAWNRFSARKENLKQF